jgi:formate hydrogenlyase subunit 3/multisubunit Na+/H+ antiporter MnhD subunit
VTALGVAALLLLAAAIAPALLARRDRLAFGAGTLLALAGCAAGFVGAASALRAGGSVEVTLDWPLPVGALRLGVDPLSAFFLLVMFLVAGLAAVHGLGAARSGPRPPTGGAAGAFAATVLAMVGVVAARDGVVFLAAWEAMTVASYFLVAHQDERHEARRAGMTYLIFSHVGGALLFLLFGSLARHGGSFSFAAVRAAGPVDPGLAAALFGLALAGFGTKAAFFPLHLWAPDAYPAAPPHAAALLSGAVSKMGVYGLLRALDLLGPPPAGFGTALVAVGTATALAGALHAFAQRDLKRLVAYSSVENLGVIALGLGVGVLGRAHGEPLVAFLGFAGALLHVLGHGVVKALLLLLAGDVQDATGTRSLDRLGALGRRMPITGGAFLLGAAALAGLPALAPFVSEWTILLGGLRGAAGLPAGAAAVSVLAVTALALATGLAAAAFAKAYGLAFLGTPRAAAGLAARDPGGARQGAVLVAAGVCLSLGLSPETALAVPSSAAALAAGLAAVPSAALGPAGDVARAVLALVLLAAAVAGARRLLLRRREVRTGPTWACGYEAPTSRMQYTAASFPAPALGTFEGLLARSVEGGPAEGYFPAAARREERLADVAGERFIVPLTRRFLEALAQVRVLQGGRLQLYLLYVLATLIALLAWQLVLSP